MATTETQHAGSSGTDSGVQKKTVTVVAYAENDAFKSERAMADELDPSRDYYERDRRVDRTVELVVEDDDALGGETTEAVYCESVRDALVDADIESDVLSVREERDVSRPYAYRPSNVASDLRDKLCREELPEELAGGVSRRLWNYKWQTDDRETKVHVRSDGIDYRRVLVHHSKRGGRKKYETRRKHLSMAFTIELGPEEGHVVDAWSDEVVGTFASAVAREDWVHKVRVTNCTETVEREGDCFDVA